MACTIFASPLPVHRVSFWQAGAAEGKEVQAAALYGSMQAPEPQLLPTDNKERQYSGRTWQCCEGAERSAILVGGTTY